MNDTLQAVNNLNGTYDILFNGLVAVGTILLAIIAIYGDKIRSWLFKPNLKISIKKEPPYTETFKTERSFNKSMDFIEKYTTIRLKVENVGSIPAKDCQGIAQEIWTKRDSNEKYYKKKTLAPSPFLWFNEHSEYTIPNEIPSYLEIARIKKTEIRTQDTGNLKKLSDKNSSADLYLSIPEPGKKGVYIKLGKGTFIIPIVIYADNVKNSSPYYVEIFWDGKEVDKLEDSVFYATLIENKNVPKEIKEIKDKK